MALGELGGWAALLLSVLLAIQFASLARRFRRIEKQLRALKTGSGLGGDTMTLAQAVANQDNRIDSLRLHMDALSRGVADLERDARGSVQRVGLVRYNPFQDTGGDQSFSLALLDKRGDGVIISSLHGRTSTRLYAKPVQAGSSPLSLSDEEMQALKQATEPNSAKAGAGQE